MTRPNCENVGLMMRARHMTKTMVNKTDCRDVTMCRNNLYTVGLVTGFDDDDVRSNVQ